METCYRGIRLSWSIKQFGPAVGATTSQKLRDRLIELKLERKYPLAQKFCDLMLPENKKNAEKKRKSAKNILTDEF